jgi:hypothetical protein
MRDWELGDNWTTGHMYLSHGRMLETSSRRKVPFYEG